MKNLIKILITIAILSSTNAEAGCKYIYINGVAYWVCDYN